MFDRHSSENRFWNFMNYRLFAPSTSMRVKKAVFAALTLTSLVGGQVLSQGTFIQPVQAKTDHHQKNWRANLYLARLTQSNQLVMQMDIQDKPITTYANAVYILYAKQNSEWVQVYTSQGARLITNSTGRTVLVSETVDCEQLKQKLGVSDLDEVELKAVAMFRYDEEGRDRDQRVEYEQIQTFTRIAQTQTTQLVALRSDDDKNYINSSNQKEHRGFHLTIARKSQSNQKVIARVSLKSRISQGYQAERLIGDFKYKLKDSSKAQFMKGVKAGDRVVVRLFSEDNEFIGYSEFELLAQRTAVTLVLGDRASEFGVVRTIYGADSGESLSMDSRTVVYDYFTQVTRADRYTNSQVTFLRQAQSIDLQSFDIAGYPRPQSNCIHPSSFSTGAFTLVNQVFSVFNSSLARSISALPGTLIRTINVSSRTTSIYEVSQQIRQSQQVSTVRDRYDDDDDDKKKKCKSRGNGRKACSANPGHSGNDRDNDD